MMVVDCQRATVGRARLPRSGLVQRRLCGALHNRRGMDSLSTLVKETLAIDPYAGDVFVFRAKRADRFKILVWDGSGLVLLNKRLERGRFTWPPVQDGAVTLSTAQLTLLFSGVDWSQVVPRTAFVAHQEIK